MIGRVLLCACAVVSGTTSGARAEDAVKADQSTYAESSAANECEAYGSGFARLPGTSTCVRVSGSASFEQRFSGASGGDRRNPE